MFGNDYRDLSDLLTNISGGIERVRGAGEKETTYTMDDFVRKYSAEITGNDEFDFDIGSDNSEDIDIEIIDTAYGGDEDFDFYVEVDDNVPSAAGDHMAELEKYLSSI